MKKIQRFMTIKKVRIDHKECGIVDFNLILDRKDFNNFKYYLTEDGEYDCTVYKVDKDFNTNMIKDLNPDFYRDNYEQLSDYDEKENQLLDDIFEYLNGKREFVTI